jgi:2-(1,2-epoxy-1,2-dihydrophenyl)acetyl-CoA isomerase
MPDPVIASAQGSEIGIGFSFVPACDLAIAAASASSSLAYCHVGLSADGGSTYTLPRIVGERKALEIALLGEKLSAQQADTQAAATSGGSPPGLPYSSWKAVFLKAS